MFPDVDANGSRHCARRLSAACDATADRPTARHGDMAAIGQAPALFDLR